MTFQVMNSHKGLAMQPRQGAARDRGHQQGPHQARRGGGGDAIELGHGHAAVAAHLLNQLGQGLDVAPRGDFRHHATPAGVLLHLGGDGTGEHRLIPHNRCRRLVTTCFEGQNQWHWTSTAPVLSRSVILPRGLASDAPSFLPPTLRGSALRLPVARLRPCGQG